MLDIKFIRENKDVVKAGAVKKHIVVDIDALLALDDERRKLLASLDARRTEQNQFSEKIAKAADQIARAGMIADMKTLKDSMVADEESYKEVLKKWHALMVQVPNVPDMTVPDGESDAQNKEVRTWGEKPQFAFKPKTHIELMESLDLADFERGIKVAGFRGYILKNDAVLLNFAIWQCATDHFTKKGFSPLIVPSLVRKEPLMGTGFLPQGEEDLYKTQDGDYLAGTAEVATMGIHADEILDKSALPIKYLSFSPCFRREAGSHSRDVKGLIRVHEFFKLEQVVICEAAHEESVKNHEAVNRNTEEFIELLGIPYHTVINCGGDLGLGQVKKYDIELWVPLENKYREISSASYFHDYQTRRLNIKYRDTDGKLKYTHSLNSTAIPTPRILVSLIENYQQADGTIAIPKALQPYMSGKTVIGKPNGAAAHQQ